MENKKIKELLETAKNLQKNAYAPYSNFRVAAIVILNNGKQITGVNIENAAYSVGICAERTALSQVITQGYQKEDIDMLFLITDSKRIAFPCGICRQFMVETMLLDSEIYISNHNMTNIKEIKKVKIKDLLPLAFLPESLKE